MALCFSPKYLTNNKILVCYHSNCTDGFSAGVVAYSKFNNQADYLSVQYNKEYDIEIFRNKEVYVVDFSFSREFCEQINKVAKSLVILDHHITAQSALEGLPYAKFDMTKSGALLTWEYFYPELSAPIAIKYVSDGDLWKRENKNVIYFGKAIRTLSFDLQLWFETFQSLQNPTFHDSFIAQGKAIDVFTNQQVDFNVAIAQECEINGHLGLIVNCSTVFTSEVGNKLAEKSGTYGATYVIDKSGDVLLSLRSTGKFDVSVLAKELGGGGHVQASGFKINISKLQFINEKIIIGEKNDN